LSQLWELLEDGSHECQLWELLEDGSHESIMGAVRRWVSGCFFTW